MFDGVVNSVDIVYVEPDMLARWAERVCPHLDKMAASSGGRYLRTDLLVELASGRMQLWLAIDGPALLCVLVTEIKQFPRCREMWLIGLVGHQPRRWAHLLPAVEAVAKRDFRCDKLASLHMPRFAALLPGYMVTHWLSEKPL
jgi:hypothetical protein